MNSCVKSMKKVVKINFGFCNGMVINHPVEYADERATSRRQIGLNYAQNRGQSVKVNKIESVKLS